MYAVWKGEGSDQRLWFAHFDGTNWSSQSQIPGVGSSVGAAIAQYADKIYAMWVGEGSDSSLYLASFSGSAWSSQSKVIPGDTGPDSDRSLLPSPSGGNSNYLFADSGGANLSGTSIQITIAEDIVPDSTDNYSFQINCNGAAQPSGAAPFVWQQFGFRIASGQIFAWVNCFRQQDLPGSPMINWDSRPPRMPGSSGVVSLPSNRLRRGSQLTTTFTTDHSGNVTGFAFGIALPGEAVLDSPTLTLLSLNSSVKASNLAPVLNFQVILVGENGGATTDFSAGEGVFLCSETNNLVASSSQIEAAEGSDVNYAALPASYPNGEFYQFFGISEV